MGLRPIYHRIHQACGRKAVECLGKLAPVYFGSKLRNPIFIVGCGRSGTTLLVNLLRRHKDCSVFPGEAPNLWHPAGAYRTGTRSGDALPPFWVKPREFARVSLERRSARHGKYIRGVFGACKYLKGNECFVHKSTLLVFIMPYVLQWFPEARFVHLVRDGRAVAFSWAKRAAAAVERAPSAYETYGIDGEPQQLRRICGATWRKHIEEMDKLDAGCALQNRGRLFECSYEQLCRAPSLVLQSFAEFADLDKSRFELGDLSYIRSMNYKYREALSHQEIHELNALMAPALIAKGYAL
ncbi:MAG: sulfotransferase family protein [bacterium]